MTNQEAWKLYERYLEGWKASSDADRQTVVDEVLAKQMSYSTRNHESGDRQAVLDDMAAFQERFPGGWFEVGDVSTHHDVALLTWVLVEANGNVFARGHDQLRVSSDGKIVNVTTFPPSTTQP